MRKAVLVGLFLACGVAGLAAPPERPNPLNARESQLLEKFLAGTPDLADLGDGGGVTAQTLAFLGREDLVMARPFTHARRNCMPLLDQGAPVDPVAYVARRAADFRVTMINEAHDMPQTRAFNAEIASALRNKGYALYGAETFNDGIGADSPAWPLLSDGYYAGEPIYGRLIRRLRALGYQLFPYEFRASSDSTLPPTDQINRREEGQAVNLAARLHEEPADAKILLHVGYGHLNKNAVAGAAVEMMAARFRKNTGIDPLTVDQTVFWSRNGAYVVCDPEALHFSDSTQIFLGAPRPSFTRKRPAWRLAAGDRFADIPPVLRRPDEAVVCEAHLSSEPDAAVPLDRLLVRPGEDIPLLLPPGRYRVSAWSRAHGWSASLPLLVGN